MHALELLAVVAQHDEVVAPPGNSFVVFLRLNAAHLQQFVAQELVIRILFPNLVSHEPLQLRAKNRSLEVGHPVVGGQHLVLVSGSADHASDIVVETGLLGEFLIIGEDDASLARGQGFGLLEGEAAHITDGPHFAPFPLSALSVSAVFHQYQAVLLHDGQNLVEVHRIPAVVDNHCTLCSVSDGFLHRLRGNTGRFWVDVDEYGHGPYAGHDGTGRSDEGNSRNQYLIARLDTAGQDC